MAERRFTRYERGINDNTSYSDEFIKKDLEAEDPARGYNVTAYRGHI